VLEGIALRRPLLSLPEPAKTFTSNRNASLLFVLASVLFLASCSGGSSEAETTTPNATPPPSAESPTTSAGPSADTDVEIGAFGPASDASLVAADRLVALLADQAGVAVLLALDRGYVANQLVAAAGSDALSPLGVIADETPSEPAAGVFSEAYDPVISSLRSTAWREQIAIDDVRTVLAEAQERARELGRRDDAAGVIALILDLARAGYDGEQIIDILTTPKSHSFGRHTADESTIIGPVPRDCDLVIGPSGETVIPNLTPSYRDCQTVIDAVRAARVIRIEAEVTAGPVIDGSS